MKTFIHTLSIAMSVIILAASCNKTDSKYVIPAQEQQQTADDGLFDVRISFTSALTKALKNGAEEQVNSVQIYVFDEDNDNRLETFNVGTSKNPVVRLSAGNKLFKVLVNSKVDSSLVTSLDALNGMLSDFSDNRSDNFVMSGELSKEITASTPVEIEVSRLAAKVVLSKITTDFSAPVYAAKTFTVDSIYLTNVAQKCQFFAENTYTPDSWSKGYALTADSVHKEVKDKKYEEPHIFYTYPNGIETPTRLVILATLGDTQYYYPIDLGTLESNMVYSVTDIKITRPGSDSEDEPVVSSEIAFTIKVADWDSQENNIQEIL